MTDEKDVQRLKKVAERLLFLPRGKKTKKGKVILRECVLFLPVYLQPSVGEEAGQEGGGCCH
jgi:hypothetical protein